MDLVGPQVRVKVDRPVLKMAEESDSIRAFCRVTDRRTEQAGIAAEAVVFFVYRPIRLGESQGRGCRDHEIRVWHMLDLLLCCSAERQASPAAGSRSDAGAEAGGSQVQALVRCGLGTISRLASLCLCG